MERLPSVRPAVLGFRALAAFLLYSSAGLCFEIPNRRLRALDCQYIVNNDTCLFNQSLTTTSDILVEWDQHVLIQGAVIKAQKADFFYNPSIKIHAGGSVVVDSSEVDAKDVLELVAASVVVTNGASLRSEHTLLLQADCPDAAGATVLTDGVGKDIVPGQVVIDAAEIRVLAPVGKGGMIQLQGGALAISNSVINATDGDVSLGDSPKCKCTKGVRLENKEGQSTALGGTTVKVLCGGGTIHVADNASMTATTSLHIENTGGNVGLECVQTGLTADSVKVKASGDANVTTVLSTRVLELEAGGDAAIGFSGQWGLEALSVRGGSISVNVQRISTQGDTCEFGASQKEDVCERALKRTFPGSMDAVRFNLSFVTQGALTVSAQTSISAASVLLCAGGQATLDEGVLLDTSGRGCPASKGFRPGEWRELQYPPFSGGGGGGHVGDGGAGCGFDALQVNKMALGGNRYDTEFQYTLPTWGASGGGCRYMFKDCDVLRGMEKKPSAGGGLVWLSAKSFVFRSNVKIKADGHSGTEEKVIVFEKSGRQTYEVVSGSGAGGTILLFADSITADQQSVARFTATGGPIACSHFPASSNGTVGGGGGGGFVGFHLGSSPNNNSVEVSVAGGGSTEDCVQQAGVPTKNVEDSYGQSGSAMSLIPCKAGTFGVFCRPCQAGEWSEGSRCRKCTNKPNNKATYDQEGWPNATCSYICKPGVPDVRVNPDCLDGFLYTFQFFGGVWGVVTIVLCLVFTAGFLLWRRASRLHHIRTPTRRTSDALGSGSFFVTQGPLSRFKCIDCLLRRLPVFCRCGGRRQDRTRPNSSSMTFPREHVPHHVCRVYLQGQNTIKNPWVLCGVMPLAICDFVEESQWRALEAQVKRTSAVSRQNAIQEMLVRCLYPPLVAMSERRHRQHRARAMHRLVQQLSEGTNGRSNFWKPLRGQMAGELGISFGCDDGATLGFLDFFDYSKCQRDWAPTDLKQEAWVLVAAGLGTFDEPLYLDIDDHLVWHLGQTDFGALPICSVISTFNRISRTLTPEDIDQGCRGATFARLREKVEQCASRCGLTGFVTVVPILPSAADDLELKSPTSRTPQRSASFSVPGYSSRAPSLHRGSSVESSFSLSPADSASGSAAGPCRFEARFESLMEGAHSGLDIGPERREAAPSTTTVAKVASMGLVFTDLTALSWRASMTSLANWDGAIATPVSIRYLSDQFERPPPQLPGSPIIAVTSDTSSVLQEWRKSASMSGFLVRWGRMLPCPTPGSVLLTLVLVMFADMLNYVLVFAMLAQISGLALTICIFIPPLVHPLAIFLGPLFLLSEHPGIGRLFAKFTMFSLVSVVSSSLVLGCLLSGGSAPYVVVQMLFTCCLKLALLSVSTIHIGHLEAALDQRVLFTEQGDFVNNVLSDTPGVRGQFGAGRGEAVTPEAGGEAGMAASSRGGGGWPSPGSPRSGDDDDITLRGSTGSMTRPSSWLRLEGQGLRTSSPTQGEPSPF